MITVTIVQNYENSCYLYEKISLYCGIAALVFLLLTMVLFFVLHISQAFGELTGRTARRAVRRMTDNDPRRDGKKNTPVSRIPRNSAAMPDVMQRTPAAFLAGTAAPRSGETETVALRPEEMETVALQSKEPVAAVSGQENVMQRESRIEQKGKSAVLRDSVKIHTDEVTEI